MWPDHVQPERAGLTEAELLRIAHAPVQDGDDLELLRVAGVEVLTVTEAEGLGIPEVERDLEHGVVIVDEESSFIQIDRVLWAGFQNAKDEERRRAAEIEKLGRSTPVPFWLAFAEPMPEAMLFDVPEDAEELDVPQVDDVRGWSDVDADTLQMLAYNVLILTHPANLCPYRYMRGSRVHDLVERSIRPLTEWLADYPHMVIEQLGGKANLESMEVADITREDAVPFWDVLEMPANFTPPGRTGKVGDTMEAAHQLLELDFFEQHGLDRIIDQCALARYGVRSIDAWRDSDFAPLMRD